MGEVFTEEQREAVLFGNGVMELVAGPGSGKTFVVTRRIQHLITSHGVSGDRILVVTFTKAAAGEMRKRFIKLCGAEGDSVTFGTFHAVFYRILRSHPDYRGVSLVPDRVRYNYISDILKRQHMGEIASDSERMQNMLGIISRVKNEGEVSDEIPLPVKRAGFDSVMKEYETALHENGYLDFDDMVMLCRHILTEDADFCSRWQKRFTHILIDEFQDICLQQYETIRILASPDNNIFAVGDDDQSIYGFRGARPDIMERLLRDYPECRRLCLSVNFRSGSEIISAASTVIGENKIRIPKNITAGLPESGSVRYLCCKSKEEMERMIVKESGQVLEYVRDSNSKEREMETVKENGVRECENDSIAVLCRKNTLCSKVVSLLIRGGVNCDVREGARSRFDWFFVRDMLTYMTCAVGPLRRELLFKIMNRPVRYIRRGAAGSEIVDRKAMVDYYNGNRQMQETVLRFFRDLDMISGMRPFLAVNYIRKVIGYDKWALNELNSEARAEYMEKADAFQKECLSVDNVSMLREMVEMDMREIRDLNIKNERRIGTGVKVMTFHGSKGLEFDKVILPYVNEGMVPPRQSHSIGEMEEERRMFYVAMTRARKELIVIYLDSEMDTPSRFIQKLIDPYDRTGKWTTVHLK